MPARIPAGGKSGVTRGQAGGRRTPRRIVEVFLADRSDGADGEPGGCGGTQPPYRTSVAQPFRLWTHHEHPEGCMPL